MAAKSSRVVREPAPGKGSAAVEAVPDFSEREILEDQRPASKTPEITNYMRPADFWKATKAYQPRIGTDYHLYRRHPVIDRKLTGHEKTVLDVQQEMDRRYILEHWGSGEYRLYFHDVNRKGDTEVCFTILRLEDPNFPPVVDQRELVVGHPRNIGFIEGLKARGLWQRDMNSNRSDSAAVAAEVVGLAKDVIAQHSRNAAPAQPVGLGETMGMMASGFKTVLEQVVNPFDSLAKAKAVLSSEPSGPFVQLVTDLLDQQNKLVLKLLDSRTAPQPAPAEPVPAGLSLVAQTNEMLDLVDRLKQRQVSVESPWSGVLVEIARAFTPVIAGLVLNSMQAAPVAEWPAVARVGAAAAVGPRPPAAPAPDPSKIAGASAATDDLKGGIPVGFPQALVMVAQGAVQAFQIGVSGDSFADAVVRKHGEAAYEAIAALGREAILGAISFYPQVAQRIGDRMPEVEQFVDDFLEYGQEPAAQASSAA